MDEKVLFVWIGWLNIIKPSLKSKVNESTEEEIKKMKTEINEVENRGK